MIIKLNKKIKEEIYKRVVLTLDLTNKNCLMTAFLLANCAKANEINETYASYFSKYFTRNKNRYILALLASKFNIKELLLMDKDIEVHYE